MIRDTEKHSGSALSVTAGRSALLGAVVLALLPAAASAQMSRSGPTGGSGSYQSGSGSQGSRTQTSHQSPSRSEGSRDYRSGYGGHDYRQGRSDNHEARRYDGNRSNYASRGDHDKRWDGDRDRGRYDRPSGKDGRYGDWGRSGRQAFDHRGDRSYGRVDRGYHGPYGGVRGPHYGPARYGAAYPGWAYRGFAPYAPYAFSPRVAVVPTYRGWAVQAGNVFVVSAPRLPVFPGWAYAPR